MAAINEAYHVLSDPGRRLQYDRSLHPSGSAAGRTTASGTRPRLLDDEEMAMLRRRGPTVLSPDGPARVPWKLMAFAAVIGSAAVLIGAAFNDAPADEVPDGVLRAGSCVEIQPNTDAKEIACGSPDDLVVELLIPTGATCPAGLAAHRDRLGLGTVCTKLP